jgi:hypothetical protein
MPERIPFLQVFNELSDGALSPRVPIDVNGVSFGPGVVFQRGVIFGGIDFQLYKYRDIAVERQATGVLRIVGFY